MNRSQDEVFAAFEGNHWFERNKDVLGQFDPDKDLPLRLFELYNLRPHTVLEVGAANGFRLAAINQRYDSNVVAVEPSAMAVGDGRERFPTVKFVQAEANEIPLQESFELIIVNFVFHWIDRSNLLRSVAEIDRLLMDGGFLIIGDFFPASLMKVRYHHLTDIETYTYKQNYAATFTASGIYHQVCLITADHDSRLLAAAVPEHERIGVWLLRKQCNEHYR